MSKDKIASRAKADISRELRFSVDTCARCGFCKPACTTHPFGGGFEAFSPRAKVHYIKQVLEGKKKLTPDWVDRLYQCTTCERCEEVCQTDIPLVHLWEALRAKSVEQGIGPMPMHLKLRENVDTYSNPYGEPTEERHQWMLPDHRPAGEADLMVFGGCTASYKMPFMLQSGVDILQRQGISYAYAGSDEVCCGSPILRTGQLETAMRLIETNIDLFHKLGVKEIVTPCGGCSKTLKADYPKYAKILGKEWTFKVKHFSEIYVDLIRKGEIRPTKVIDRKVTYHDPCHLGRSQGIFHEPREILKAIPGLTLLEMESTMEDARCCGAGGGVKANYPEIADEVADRRVMEAIETGADTLVTMCPFCQTSFSQSIERMDAPLELLGVEDLLLQSVAD